MEPKGTKRERARDAAAIALQGAGGTLKAVVFQKALFYSDLIALRDHGHTITGGVYIAAKKGPLFANSHRKLIPDLGKYGLAHQTEHGDMKPIRLTDHGFSYRSSIISENFARLLRVVAKRLSAETSTGVSHFSHKNPGWDLAWRTGKGSGRDGQLEKPVNMLIALQDPALFDPEFWRDDPTLDQSIADQLDLAERSSASPWE